MIETASQSNCSNCYFRHSLSHRTYKRNIDRTGFSHKCVHCSKTFQKPSQLERHLRIHTGRSLNCLVRAVWWRVFSVGIFGTFIIVTFLTSAGERPFKCSQCEKTFNQKGALQIHMSTHTQEKPYACEFCPATFAQKGNLRAHIQVNFVDGLHEKSQR